MKHLKKIDVTTRFFSKCIFTIHEFSNHSKQVLHSQFNNQWLFEIRCICLVISSTKEMEGRKSRSHFIYFIKATKQQSNKALFRLSILTQFHFGANKLMRNIFPTWRTLTLTLNVTKNISVPARRQASDVMAFEPMTPWHTIPPNIYLK